MLQKGAWVFWAWGTTKEGQQNGSGMPVLTVLRGKGRRF